MEVLQEQPVGSVDNNTEVAPDAPNVETTALTPLQSIGSTVDGKQSDNRKPSRLSSILRSEAAIKSLKSFRLIRENTAAADAEETKDKGPLGLTTLYDPPDLTAAVDIVFIHGLGGDSIKTWSDSSSSEPSFWPKDWLPTDPDFAHARIHTFGFRAAWQQRASSVLSVHDFAQTLLGELVNCPSIRRSHSRIILVGHSMGGLVAKKTYILAKQDPACENFATRFHSIFFLATPHRGNNKAKILQALLLIAGVKKPYINDLIAKSPSVFEVNDAFRHYAQDLRLWSFIESLPLTSISNTLIVDKFSATLGYNNEDVMYMDADHRRVCKFQNRLHHDYKKLRNALSSAVDMILNGGETSTSRSKLEAFLKVNDSFTDDFAMFSELKTPGTCAWVTDSDGFAKWMLPRSEAPPFYWIVGLPGAGKSVIASHVVSHLQERSIRCSYFFFKKGRSDAQNLTPLLLSLAYQMALQDPSIFNEILQLSEDGVAWDGQGERFVWRKLFLESIFNLKSIGNHFWVIDGLDEYSDMPSLLNLFSQVPSSLRVFITTRKTPDAGNRIHSLGQLAFVHDLVTEDTASDLQAVIYMKLEQLNSFPTEKKSYINSRILEKSSGSFLWTRLVLQELEMAFTDEDIEDVLNEVPQDLNEMYARILKSMESKRRQVKLAKTILTWVVLAVRPMTVEELHGALQLDLNQTLYDIAHAITTTCGQLVIIDQSHRVQIIHDSAREFLMGTNMDSPLMVDSVMMHGRLASICISYLTDALASNSESKRISDDTSLVPYSSKSFSRHLVQSCHENPVALGALRQFFYRGIPPWIEYLAGQNELSICTRTSTDLEIYFEAIATASLCSTDDIKKLNAWATDIGRVALRFRDPLLQLPAAIHTIIPPFCPQDSLISQNLPQTSKVLTVTGQSNSAWPDCLMYIKYQSLVLAVCCGDDHFAVGLDDGHVEIYDINLFHLVSDVTHSEYFDRKISSIHFGCKDKLIATASDRDVAIWNVRSTTMLQRWELRYTASYCFLSDSVFVAASSLGEVAYCNFKTGSVDKLVFDAIKILAMGPNNPAWGMSSCIIDQSSKEYIGFSSFIGDIYVVHIKTGIALGTFCTPNITIPRVCDDSEYTPPMGIQDFAFNPDSNLDMLIVSYSDGSLITFSLGSKEQTSVTLEVFAQTLSWFPGGRYLAAEVNTPANQPERIIEVYELLTPEHPRLELRCRTEPPGAVVQSFHFSCHDSRLVTGHNNQCQIWKPQFGSNKKLKGTGAAAYRYSAPVPPARSFALLDTKDAIVIMAVTNDSSIIICGHANGEIASFSAIDGSEIGSLHRHSHKISALKLSELEGVNMFISGDDAGSVVVAHSNHNWGEIKIMLEFDVMKRVQDILVNPAEDRLLLTTYNHTDLRELSTGKPIAERRSRALLRRIHPHSQDKFVLVEDSDVYIFHWHDFTSTIGYKISLGREADYSGYHVFRNVSTISNDKMVVERVNGGGVWHCRIHCWDIAQFLQPDKTEITPRPGIYDFSLVVQDIVALSGSRLIFIDRETWVCSIDVQTFPSSTEFRRHFPVFQEWINPFDFISCAAIAPDNSLVFGDGRNPSVIRGWEDVYVMMNMEHYSSWSDAEDSDDGYFNPSYTSAVRRFQTTSASSFSFTWGRPLLGRM